MSPHLTTKVSSPEVIYREVLNHARHYSAVRVSLGLFFWSAAGAIATQTSGFGGFKFLLCLLALVLGVFWVTFFGGLNAACWNYAEYLEGGYVPTPDEENKWKKRWGDVGFHKGFAGAVKLKFLGDTPARAHFWVSTVFAICLFLKLASDKKWLVL